MTAPERIWLRWLPGAAVTKGPLTSHPDFTGFIRHDAAALAASPVVQDMIRQAVEAEREACAKVADDMRDGCERNVEAYSPPFAGANPELQSMHEGGAQASSNLAAAIRARKGE